MRYRDAAHEDILTFAGTAGNTRGRFTWQPLSDTWELA